MPLKENVLIYVLRRDLRLDDNPVFQEIARLYKSGEARFTHVLPLYIFCARQVEVSGFFPASDPESPVGLNSPYPQAKSLVGKFWRCGPHRARFLAESVWDLKQTLKTSGSGLCVRAGYLVDVVKDALEYFEASGNRLEAEIVGVWMTGEETTEEVEDERNIRTLVEANGKEFRLFKDEKYFIDE
jgi:deoxyribodipyrimidine photo-lyase